MEFESFETEMNRGFIQLLIMVMLDKPMYGYEIVKELDARGYVIEENTLYPLLRRLEQKDILKSEWQLGDGKPRKYYEISSKGKVLKKKLLEIWDDQNLLLQEMLGGIDDVQES